MRHQVNQRVYSFATITFCTQRVHIRSSYCVYVRRGNENITVCNSSVEREKEGWEWKREQSKTAIFYIIVWWSLISRWIASFRFFITAIVPVSFESSHNYYSFFPFSSLPLFIYLYLFLLLFSPFISFRACIKNDKLHQSSSWLVTTHRFHSPLRRWHKVNSSHELSAFITRGRDCGVFFVDGFRLGDKRNGCYNRKRV